MLVRKIYLKKGHIIAALNW